MRLVIIPLFLLMFTAILYGLQNVGGYLEIDDLFTDPSTSMGSNVLGNVTLNSTDTYYESDATVTTVSFDAATGAIAVIVAAVAFVAVLGIQVMGSGLSDVGLMAVFKTGVFFGFWALFSVLAVQLYNEIPLFGMPLYFLLTIVYGLGVVEQIGGSSGS